jgi:tRNA A-37 threonylcarbamoyl transferase component Bud32
VNCPQCNAEVLDIDIKCGSCGAALGATGAQRMIGQTVLGQYELADVLGQGGMSVVFKGKHKMTDQEVALKILPPELAAHSQVKSRFLDEAKALAALDHPNIVHLYNFGQENGSFVLAMQFVQGKTWERMILEAKRLDWKTSCKITIDVLKALEYAHGRGVVHRDMKPSNVLVRSHDGMATVMDFGIAKMTTSTRLTATGQTMGTVRYMSPEQVRGQEVDLRTDIYSLGATLYESLVGDTPFDGQTHFEIMTKHLSEAPKRPSSLGVEVPEQIEEALMKSLSKKPEDRFDNARDMRKVLEAALKDNDVALVETQRFGRDELAALPPKKSAIETTPRAATAASLADMLEPGMTGARPAVRSKKWPFALAVGVVVAGAGAAAYLLVNRPAGYHATTRIKGVTLTAGKRFDGGKLLVETDGVLTPDEVAAAYHDAMRDLHTAGAGIDAHYDVIDVIVAVPQPTMCEPSAYPVDIPPAGCKLLPASHAIGAGGKHVLLVADGKAGLDAAIRKGVGDAVCGLQPAYYDNLDPKKADQICALTAKFAGK